MTTFKKPASVKGTLLVILLPAGVALMAIAWFAHGALLERMSREFVTDRLKEEVSFLEHQIRDSDGAFDGLKTGDYFQRVFHHAFVQHSDSRTIISPESWKPLLSPLIKSEKEGTIRVENSEIAGAPTDILAYRSSFIANEKPFVVIVAEDLGALKNSQAELHAWTAIASLLLISLMVCAIWLGVNLSMHSVTRLKASLKRLQDGSVSRIDMTAPEEFHPLVEQLNQLLDSLDQRLERSRNALANLSHSVKTPIASVQQILSDTSTPLDSELRQQIAARLGDIDKQLEAEMRRSRFAGPQVGKSCYPVEKARDLLWMMGRLYPAKSFELSSSLPENSRWPIVEYDLSEILGIVLDNAGKWSHREVELILEQCGPSKRIVVTDDGPGVEEAELSKLGQRGLRLDEQTPGHGLGLAIVQDIVSRYGAKIVFSNRPRGGLKVTIEF
jgi:signal transduction histidine kinase